MRELTPQQQEEAELQQIRQRPGPYQPKHIGTSIRKIMARTGLGQTQAALEMSQAWERVAGPRMAATTRPGNFSRGVLQIIVDNSSAMQEFQLSQRQLLSALQREMPNANIQSIKARLGGR